MGEEFQQRDPLEAYFAASTVSGLVRSGLSLLGARHVRTRSQANTKG